VSPAVHVSVIVELVDAAATVGVPTPLANAVVTALVELTATAYDETPVAETDWTLNVYVSSGLRPENVYAYVEVAVPAAVSVAGTLTTVCVPFDPIASTLKDCKAGFADEDGVVQSTVTTPVAVATGVM